jgi:CheY-like chemotaxis protein
LAATPIVLVTIDDDRTRGINAGASEFLRKPVSEAQLRHIISVYDEDLTGDVLIIDDDDDAAEIMARNLERLGFTAHRAADGADGLKQVGRIAPKAIVLDLNMPNMNGFEFLNSLAAQTVSKAIPVVVVSGQDLSLRDRQKLVAAGCRFFLKGFSAPREIAESLRELLA